jgi:hypothetical protein
MPFLKVIRDEIGDGFLAPYRILLLASSRRFQGNFAQLLLSEGFD